MNKNFENIKKSTFPQNTIILASSSETRIKILKKYRINARTMIHTVNEQEIRNKMSSSKPKKVVEEIARRKAYSIGKDYPKQIVIGSDQILVYKNKIFSKAKSKKDALKLFILLQDQKYKLISSIFIMHKKKYIWNTTKTAKILMNKTSIDKIKKYINNNEKEVLTVLGGYKIESDKLDCIQILKGHIETIQGFPINKFIKKIKKNEITSNWKSN